ncbi:GIN1 [Cordylochernes scorpioides]|uniref:GIN1 n=1 Tax=Cordylochernes scorpioides TaxID=51811 RepID=A0ABY6KIG5_9ARAC|nr:GIN1 [Cordylochernes scorpioides]
MGPPDFFLFPKAKRCLKGHRFNDDIQNIQQAMVRRDTFFEDVLTYLTTGEFWEGATEADKKVMQTKAASFEVLDGQLYRASGDQRRLVLTDPERRLQVIQECHVAPDGIKHLGREMTKRAVATNYYWSGMNLDIRDFVRQCPECYAGETRSTGRSPFGGSIGKRSHLWKMVEVEVSGPFSMESKSCLVNVIDLVSKWISCLPVPAMNAREIARTLVAEFAVMGLPSAVRFVRLTQELATEVVSELEKELDRFMNTLEDVSDLLKQEGTSGEVVTCPKLAISQVSEDSQFTIRDLETLEVFVSNRQAQGEDDLSLYILVGQDSLLEESTRLWHLDTFSRFRKLYPEDSWSERLSYFSYCLRSCLPPPSAARTPNYLMFFRDMDIFKLAPDKLPSEDEESPDKDLEDSGSHPLQIYRFPDNTGQVSIEFEDEEEQEDKENEEEEYTELSSYQPSDTNGLVDADLTPGVAQELTERRGLRTSPRKTNSLYARNTSPSLRRKRLPDLYESEDDEDNMPPKKRKKPFIVALRGKERLTCPNCSEVLSQTELEQHLSFHPDSGPGLKCPVCGKMGQNWGPMYHHFTTHHPEHCPDPSMEETAQTSDMFSCNDCSFTTKLQRNFRIHRRMHEKVCFLQCHLCNEVFSHRSALSQHLTQVHHSGGGQRVLCEHCGVSLKSRGSLMAHVKRMHRETQWLLCSHCGFKAKTTSNLNAHIDRIHKKAFHCTICGFATKEKNSYSSDTTHFAIYEEDVDRVLCRRGDGDGVVLVAHREDPGLQVRRPPDDGEGLSNERTDGAAGPVAVGQRQVAGAAGNADRLARRRMPRMRQGVQGQPQSDVRRMAPEGAAAEG